MSVWDWALLTAAGVMAVPVGVVLLETVAAVARSFQGRGAASRHGMGPQPGEHQMPHVAVLVPAHNEEQVIGPTLAEIRRQLPAGDRLVVVADNCTDRTAAVARQAGAEVLERQDELKRGKGYALAAGLEYLGTYAHVKPEVVLVVDADMKLAAGSVLALTNSVAGQAVPFQAIDLLGLPAKPSLRARLSAFAFLFKNQVRALGAEAWAVPCCLRGTGMAFPWRALEGAKLANGNLVEDMQLGVDLAIAGFVPRLCPEARVTGVLPEKTAVQRVQRTRWEQGHLQTILHHVPRLVWEGLRQHRLALWLLALDLAVPPLALLVLAWVVVTASAAGAACVQIAGWAPLAVLAAVGGMLMVSILAAWACFARHIVPWVALLAVPFYVLWKIPVYAGFLLKREKTWIRTERNA
jgi:cellulose synthase/poly-beta-1,6-N-acetylglucosamine synthase-like glycosyltransferase